MNKSFTPALKVTMQEIPTDIARPSFIKTLRLKRILGAGICLGGFLLLLLQLVSSPLWTNERMTGALMGGGAAALATALGTFPILLSQNFSQRTHDGFVGFGAGVMLAATSFSLLVPAITASRAQYGNAFNASATVACALLAGALLIAMIDRVISADMIKSFSVRTSSSMRHAWLFVLAVALHNLPEGLAIGVAYGGIDLEKANSLATGISIQDVPEGLVVALALRSVGYTRIFSVVLGVASGLIEPVAAVVGVLMIDSFAGFLPIGLAAAAGAMLFVLCRDVIPESHAHNNSNIATGALLFGFAIMTILDTALSEIN
jgi:ZIP family zinc transporter